MKEVVLSKPFSSEEEYFAFEEKSELKHEYIDSKLFEMEAYSIPHNKMERWFTYVLQSALDITGEYEVFGDDCKVRTPNGNFFYTDIIVDKADTEGYYTEKPVLLAEIFSDSSRVFDLVDKSVQYRQIPSLEYYLCIEPKKIWVSFFYKMTNNHWSFESFVDTADVINLPKLGISLQLKDIYQS